MVGWLVICFFGFFHLKYAKINAQSGLVYPYPRNDDNDNLTKNLSAMLSFLGRLKIMKCFFNAHLRD